MTAEDKPMSETPTCERETPSAIELRKVVVVKWIDAYHHKGWHEAAEDAKTFECESVGYLIRSDEKSLVLSQSRALTESNTPFCDLLTIPTACICTISEMKICAIANSCIGSQHGLINELAAMSDTPRTNAVAPVKPFVTDSDHWAVDKTDYDALLEVSLALERELAAEREAHAETKKLDATAGRLIDAWVADKGRQIPWAKAVQIVAIVTKQPDSERDRLLKMDDEDGSCGMCGRSDEAVTQERAARERAEARITAALEELDGYEDVEDRPNGEGVRPNLAMRVGMILRGEGPV